MVKITMQFFGGNGASSKKAGSGGAGGTKGELQGLRKSTSPNERWYTDNYNTGLTEEAFYDLIDEANAYGDESLFPRLPGRGGAYVYEGSGGELFIYDPKSPTAEFAEVAKIDKKQLKFRKS